MDNADFTLYPSKPFQLEWLREYLIEWDRVVASERSLRRSIQDVDVERLYNQVQVFAAVSLQLNFFLYNMTCIFVSQISHLFWSVWSIVQAHNSTIDFDFLQYGIDRYEEYLKMIGHF